ncbi:MAG TPA: TlpA disulfide reductase family protein [Trueperaceae bacterium]
MSAYQLGPFVLGAPRFYAALGLVVLVLAAEVAAWRGRLVARGAEHRARAGHGEVAAPGEEEPALPAEGLETAPPSAAWAWNAALAVLVGARLGFVLENLGAFVARPLEVLQFWQGGFSPWWGVGAGALTAAWSVARRRVAVGAVALSAVLALGAWLGVPALLTPAEQQARRLPGLVLERLEGGELDLASLRGQPVVINMWATWCPPCRRELPMLASAARTYPDVRFVFADQAESREAVLAYLAERQELELPDVVLDANASLSGEFGTIGLPTTLFFDAEGNHVLTHAGELSSVLVVNYLADLRRGER